MRVAFLVMSVRTTSPVAPVLTLERAAAGTARPCARDNAPAGGAADSDDALSDNAAQVVPPRYVPRVRRNVRRDMGPEKKLGRF